MTDRHAGYLVVLADDIRDDDAEESVLVALRMIKGVAAVTPVLASYEQVIARTRRDGEWREALWDLARNGPPGGDANHG
jgi:hypothetical protein